MFEYSYEVFTDTYDIILKHFLNKERYFYFQ